MLDISKQKMDLECPECKFVNAITLKQIKNEELIKCKGCSKNIKLTHEDSSVLKSINDSEKAIKDLEKALKDFSR